MTCAMILENTVAVALKQNFYKKNFSLIPFLVGFIIFCYDMMTNSRA